jgi:hypothetical protein
MTQPSLGDLLYLSSYIFRVNVTALTTLPDTPNQYSAQLDIMGDQGDLDLTNLVGPAGPAGNASYVLRDQTNITIVNNVFSLPQLEDIFEDIGKYWRLDTLDGYGHVIFETAYVWFGNGYRAFMMGAYGPPGPLPAVIPECFTIEPGTDSYVHVTGPTFQPSWQFELAVPRGPAGPVTPIAFFPDVEESGAGAPVTEVVTQQTQTQQFATAGTYTYTIGPDVTHLDVVALGAGGGGDSAGVHGKPGGASSVTFGNVTITAPGGKGGAGEGTAGGQGPASFSFNGTPYSGGHSVSGSVKGGAPGGGGGGGSDVVWWFWTTPDNGGHPGQWIGETFIVEGSGVTTISITVGKGGPGGDTTNPGAAGAVWIQPYIKRTVPAPESGNVLTATGYLESGELLWQPLRIENGAFFPYSMPEGTLQKFSGKTAQKNVGSFSIPPQPFTWTPVVWGHIGSIGGQGANGNLTGDIFGLIAELIIEIIDAIINAIISFFGGFLSGGLSAAPLNIGCEVLLGTTDATGLDGIMVARGFGNDTGVVNISPHYSTVQNEAAAIRPGNNYAVVPAYHTGNDGTLFVNLYNDGISQDYHFDPIDAQLFISVVPVGGQGLFASVTGVPRAVGANGSGVLSAHFAIHGVGGAFPAITGTGVFSSQIGVIGG